MEKFHDVDPKRGGHSKGDKLDPEGRGYDYQTPGVVYLSASHRPSLYNTRRQYTARGKVNIMHLFFSFKSEVYLKLPTRILCKGKFTRLFEEIRSVESELIKETEMKQNTQYNRCA